MGGEKCIEVCPVVVLQGSPPRGRGKEIVDVTEWPTNRITPAWAGKSAHELFEVIPNEDHPRVGGEKGSRYREQVRALGSPPRGRGKALLAECRHGVVGITPAWAGKRPQTAHRVKPQQDHPRVGGEKGRAVLGPVLGTGSPPRGRGKGITTMTFELYARITPAWAGKSRSKRTTRQSIRDHPRVGGEKLKRLRKAYRGKGSPPRGRGKVASHVPALANIGITPAWAGKRAYQHSRVSRHEDHPRVGGEKSYGGG